MRRTTPLLFLLPFLLFSVFAWGGAKAPAKSPAKGSKPATPAAKAPEKNKKVIVEATKTPLREKLGSKTKITDLTRFTPVEILSRQSKWAKIKTNDGLTGWVDGDHLADSRFVCTSISGSQSINLRAGPGGTSEPIIIELQGGYPLLVLEKKDRRVRVKDFEGDTGWAHEAYLSTKRYIVATPPEVAEGWMNLREGPGLDERGKPKYPRRFRAQRGAIFEVLEEKDGWLRVRHGDGDEGWCSANIVWGWHEKEDEKKEKKK